MDKTTRDRLIEDALVNLEHGVDWNWRDQVNAIRHLRIHVASAEAHIESLTAKLETAEQERTCKSCVHCHAGEDFSRAYRVLCEHPKAIDANKGALMMVPWPFGCSLHELKEPT